jgi:hypothetical protein
MDSAAFRMLWIVLVAMAVPAAAFGQAQAANGQMRLGVKFVF